MDLSERYAVQGAPTVMQAAERPNAAEWPTFSYQRRVLPLEGGRVLLRLRASPTVTVNPDTLECEVNGWDIRLPHSRIEDIDRRMARRFLELYSKAAAQLLNGPEEAAWLRLLEHVDYAGFSHDRAAPHYVEGRLLRGAPNFRVEWADGTAEPLPLRVGAALTAVDAGDRFGAFVKLSPDGTAQKIERVILLPPLGEDAD